MQTQPCEWIVCMSRALYGGGPDSYQFPALEGRGATPWNLLSLKPSLPVFVSKSTPLPPMEPRPDIPRPSVQPVAPSPADTARPWRKALVTAVRYPNTDTVQPTVEAPPTTADGDDARWQQHRERFYSCYDSPEAIAMVMAASQEAEAVKTGAEISPPTEPRRDIPRPSMQPVSLPKVPRLPLPPSPPRDAKTAAPMAPTAEMPPTTTEETPRQNYRERMLSL